MSKYKGISKDELANELAEHEEDISLDVALAQDIEDQINLTDEEDYYEYLREIELDEKEEASWEDYDPYDYWDMNEY